MNPYGGLREEIALYYFNLCELTMRNICFYSIYSSLLMFVNKNRIVHYFLQHFLFFLSVFMFTAN